MEPLKQKISITLDEDVIQKLKSLADGCDRSLSQYINLVLKEHLSRLDAEKESPTETL